VIARLDFAPATRNLRGKRRTNNDTSVGSGLASQRLASRLVRGADGAGGKQLLDRYAYFKAHQVLMASAATYRSGQGRDLAVQLGLRRSGWSFALRSWEKNRCGESRTDNEADLTSRTGIFGRDLVGEGFVGL
jgi:hypothetical protein